MPFIFSLVWKNFTNRTWNAGPSYLNSMAQLAVISEDKKIVAKNLYLSGIAEEFIALQLDLEIPAVIQVLKEQDIYKKIK